MKLVGILIALTVTATPVALAAQSNPFAPPQRGGGLTREQIQKIAQEEAQKAASTQTPAGEEGSPPLPAQAGTPNPAAGVPSQNGAPSGSPVGPGGMMVPSSASSDPIAELVSNGGSFMGCIGSTPVFKDKVGRRAYFTSKELKESNEARRHIRC